MCWPGEEIGSRDTDSVRLEERPPSARQLAPDPAQRRVSLCKHVYTSTRLQREREREREREIKRTPSNSSDEFAATVILHILGQEEKASVPLEHDNQILLPVER